MSGNALSSLGMAILIAILLAGWSASRVEGRPFFGTIFQDAALSNGTVAAGGAPFLQALAAAHGAPALSALADLFFGK